MRDARTAEAAKLTENVFRAVNIALVNELKILYDRMGIDVWDVLDAAAVDRLNTIATGFSALDPADVAALSQHARWQVWANKAVYWGGA